MFPTNKFPLSFCSLPLSVLLGSLTSCLYKFPDHGLSSGSCALSHGFSSLPSALLSTDEAPGGPSGEIKSDGQRKSMRDPEDAPAMDSPQIRELEMFANDFKIRRIKLGMINTNLSHCSAAAMRRFTTDGFIFFSHSSTPLCCVYFIKYFCFILTRRVHSD